MIKIIIDTIHKHLLLLQLGQEYYLTFDADTTGAFDDDNNAKFFNFNFGFMQVQHLLEVHMVLLGLLLQIMKEQVILHQFLIAQIEHLKLQAYRWN